MFLPLLASFAKGAAEGAEQMLDQEAINRFEAVSALKKAAAENPPGTIGPFTFKTGNKPGSYEYGQQQLNNLEAALGTAQGKAQFGAWIAQNDPSGNTIRREISDAIGIWSAKNQKTIREDGKPDAIIAPSVRKTYGNIYRFLNPNSTPIQDRRADQPSGPTLNMLKAESLRRGHIISYNGSTAWAAGLNLFPSGPAPSLPSGNIVEPEYTKSVNDLTSTLQFKKTNGLNIGDVNMNPSVGINHADNADVRRVVKNIQFGTRENPQFTSMAKVLNERNTSLNAEKVAVANDLWFSTANMDRQDQVPEVGLITSQFQLAHVPRNFRVATATQKQIAITPSGGSVGAVRYDAQMGDILPNSKDEYKALIEDKNSPLAKQLEMRQYQYDANLRLVNMTGTLLDYLERGVGNNMYDALKRFGGGVRGILSEIGDDMFGADDDGSAAKLEYEGIKSDLGALTSDSSDSAVYAALERLTAFAMAQIVQNKTDKISNKDVDEMKEVLGGPFRNKRQAADVIARFRSMALKSLLRVGGFATGVGPRGTLTYEKYNAANAQYQYFNRVSPSLATAEAAAKYMKNRTKNMTSYGNAGSFRVGGTNQSEMKIYVGGEHRTRKLGDMNNFQSALVYAYKNTVNNYRGSNSAEMPDWARENTLSIQKQIIKSIREGSIDTSLNQDSETFKLARDNQNNLVNHAAYIQNKTGTRIEADPVVLHLKDAGFMVAFMNKDKELFFLENNVGASIFADQDALEKAIRARPEYEVKKPPTQRLAMGGSVSVADRLRGMVQNV